MRPVIRITAETDALYGTVACAVCDTLNIDRAEIDTTRRWHDLVMARHLIRYILRTHHGWSYRLIGLYTIGGHHTTVIHSVRAMQESLDTSLMWRAYYSESMRRADAVNN